MEETLILWTEVQAWATIGTGVVLFVTLLVVVRQLLSLRNTQTLQGFIQVVDWLQKEEIRKARRTVYELAGIDHLEWGTDEKSEVEKVCHNFDVVGDMLKKKLIKKRVLENWSFNIKRCWVVAKPMIEKYRKDRRFPGLWKNFQWLAEDVYKEETGISEQ